MVLTTCVALAAFFWGAYPALAQVAPNLGVAQQFGALGNSGVTGATGTGVIVNGDVGSSPNATITNFPPSSTTPPFIVHFTNDAVVQQARQDAIAAYNFLQTQGAGTVLADDLSTVGALTSGIYSFATGAPNLPAGTTLTLNGPGIFVFNVGSTLTANVNSIVAGTADPCNIFWRVGTSATLNGVNFRGTVIADASITLGSSSNLEGRALAGTGATGAVTMAGSGGNTIGGCSTLIVPPADPPPAALTCPAGLTAGGTPGTATVTLTGPAPAGGTVVTLTSSAPGTASVPVNVTVPAGATSITFSVTPGATPGSATIRATTTGGGPVFCALVVGAAPPPIPTLDSFGLAILIVLLSGVGVFVMNRFHS